MNYYIVHNTDVLSNSRYAIVEFASIAESSRCVATFDGCDSIENWKQKSLVVKPLAQAIVEGLAHV